MNWKFTDGFISWVIKLATVVVNAPATYGLAFAAFATIGDGQVLPIPIRILVSFSAVVLLEGILLQSWARLDAERLKSVPDPSEEFRHAFKAVAMYFALLAVAFLHGEGLAGIIFRLAFGIQLGISAWDSISREIKRATTSSATGTRDWVVEGVQRRLMRKTQIYELRQFWGKNSVEWYRRDQDALIERKSIERDAERSLTTLNEPLNVNVEPYVQPTSTSESTLTDEQEQRIVERMMEEVKKLTPALVVKETPQEDNHKDVRKVDIPDSPLPRNRIRTQS